MHQVSLLLITLQNSQRELIIQIIGANKLTFVKRYFDALHIQTFWFSKVMCVSIALDLIYEEENEMLHF